MLSKGIKNVSPQRNQNKSLDVSQDQQDQASASKKSAISQENIGDHLLPEDQNQEAQMDDNQEQVHSGNSDAMNEGGDKSQNGNVSNNDLNRSLDKTPPKEENRG